MSAFPVVKLAVLVAATSMGEFVGHAAQAEIGELNLHRAIVSERRVALLA
ncbi:hypothetical protein [Mesorhizobium ciceri]|nr:hypothetical protein [Mesorhizobium ciceri]